MTNKRSSRIRGLVVAGTHSGVGKTTVTLGLLAAWRRRGLIVQPFKVGPDFIDPGHHAQAAGRTSHNLDSWMLSREENQRIFWRAAAGADLALVEGVMGLFDGLSGASEAGSTAQMAKWLGLPVLLVVDVRAMARSVAAVVKGFATFDPDLQLAGVVFNRLAGPAHLDYLREALAALPGSREFGGLPREGVAAIPERHLGLVTAEDHPLDPGVLASLADLVESHLRLDDLWQSLPELQGPSHQEAPRPAAPPVRLGVARDQAFCFYYPENLAWLRYFGAELVEFSPLRDDRLPPGLQGLYLGGGYPELYAERLAANAGLKADLRQAAQAGLPIYAECGGLMYLCEELQDLAGKRHAMAGVLPLQVRMLPRLKSLGYREVALTADSLLGPRGTTLRGHEFHYSEIVGTPRSVATVYQVAPRRGGEPQAEGYAWKNVLASYLHLHFGSNPEAARAFTQACRAVQET
jgi:cobyrinic acid a,c-diamide synthase